MVTAESAWADPSDRQVGWTVAELLDQVRHQRPVWFRYQLQHFHGQLSQLQEGLLEVLSAQTGTLAQAHTALVMVALGCSQGPDLVKKALASEEERVRDYTVLELSAVWGNLHNSDQKSAGTPSLTSAEVVEAARGLLGQPVGEAGKSLVEFSLSYAFEESLSVTGALLRQASPEIRLLVAEAYLQRGRHDDTLLSAIDDLLDSPLPEPGIERDRWNRNFGRLATAAQRYFELAPPQHHLEMVVGLVAIVRKMMAGPQVYEKSAAKGFISLVSSLWAADTTACGDLPREVAAHPQVDTLTRALAAQLTLAKDQDSLALEISLGLMAATLEDDQIKPEVATRLAQDWAERLDQPQARRRLLEMLLNAVETPRLSRGLAPVVVALADPEKIAEARVALHRALVKVKPGSEGKWTAECLADGLLCLGDNSPATLAALQPWKAAAVRWAASGLTLEELAQRLYLCGATNEVSQAQLEQARDQDPHTQILILLDSRLGYANIRDAGFDPQHQELFGRLAAAASPRVTLDCLVQIRHEVTTERTASQSDLRLVEGGDLFIGQPTVISFEGTVCSVEYNHDGKQRCFLTRPEGSWMDVNAVLKAFNAFMAEIWHQQRAFRLVPGPDANGEWAFFVVAHARDFPLLAAELHIPLHV